jgi:serine/threonine-protein kinase HipA
MPAQRESVAVEVGDPRLGLDGPIGHLSHDRRRPPGTFSFEYTRQWLDHPTTVAIDPALPLAPGETHRRSLPGVFADASPDRWGRLLLDRREQLLARRGGRPPRTLGDWDYLLGVQDETRMGALRLRDDAGRFLAQQQLAVPPLAELREVEHLAQAFEQGRPMPPGDDERWLATLIAPGSSLGGARPKATFRDPDGSLWLAKFPSLNDRRDMGAWEYVLHRLAGRAGVTVPQARLLNLGSAHHTFCTRRFDRSDGGRRLYASAMTLTGRSDREPASYLDIAVAQEQYGDADTLDEDLHQLYRRAVFNVRAAHRDDHLRNHGFLHDGRGWRPSPAFDLNPLPELAFHALALDDTSTVPSLETVRAGAPLYRLSPAEADQIIEEVADALLLWRQVAREAGLPRQEIDDMAPVMDR